MKVLTKLTFFLIITFVFFNFSIVSFKSFALKDLKEVDTIPSQNYTVVIDAGHGGSDPGSIGYKSKIHEADLNLKISKMLEQKLTSAGINVVMTRTSDSALIEGSGKKWKQQDMLLRKNIIKETRPNMVLSIHQNSYTNHKLRGAQVFYDKTSEISKQIADFIQEEFKQNLVFTSSRLYHRLLFGIL